MFARSLAACLGAGMLALPWGAAAEQTVLLEKRVFLGSEGKREWTDFDEETPDSSALSLTFQAHAQPTPATLFIRQRDVKLRWSVLLNGRKLGLLELNEVLLETALTIPPGTLREGENTLSILTQASGDDIILDRIRLDFRPLEKAVGEATLRLQATDLESHAPLPCRFTIVDRAGVLAPLSPAPGQLLAVRTGVVYTGDGSAEIRLPAGEYTAHLTRGFEYGLASQPVALQAGETKTIGLAIRREVATPGLVACDPHIHTFSFSKHGDATLEERMLTLAGEGIELPISTDHNIYVPFEEAARRMKVEKYFTPILGSEITTKTGHFIAFPVVGPSAPLPDTGLSDWPALMRSIRSVPGVQAVILNHPRNIHDGFIPFSAANFRAATGENLRGPEFSFDAMEVCNSGSLQSDQMLSYRDWFSVLNHGCHPTAVGSSDSHDVSRFIVGQARTYLAAGDGDPAKIDVLTAVDNLLKGQAYVSMGLLTKVEVDGKFGVGALATGAGKELHLRVSVLGPSWIKAEEVEVFANGTRIAVHAISTPDAAGEKAVIEWSVPKPDHDFHLVAIATGPAVREPYWNIPYPYQPQGRIRSAMRVSGASNPVFVDADEDGKYTPPREQASWLTEKQGATPGMVLQALAGYDEAVAAQAASLFLERGWDLQGPEFTRLLQQAPSAIKAGFAAVIESLMPQ